MNARAHVFELVYILMKNVIVMAIVLYLIF